TIIKYAVPERSMVSIKVYNIAGEEVITVVNEEKDIGWYEVKLYSTGLSSGIYLCRMQAGNYISIKKMMLLK
ncbi:T9SS type A sorting domain-containing protein, partial [Ignavibacterium sp.]|uniref:T9SS type A sorting domain-containing protein n=1 Tax=Ignavibacterium sp. TaxID=2651167 RepID=UPI00329708AA